MRVEVQPPEVRRLVLAAFEQLGADPLTLFDLEENVLIYEGRYTARSYRADHLMAMWLIALGLIQFYDVDGNMVRTINLSKNLKPLKMAA
jgi:hypothetical protein